MYIVKYTTHSLNNCSQHCLIVHERSKLQQKIRLRFLIIFGVLVQHTILSDEVNALQDVILGKTRMIDAVSKEREEVVKALKEKKNIEEKLRRSGNTSMLRISELEEELANTKKLVRANSEIL